MPDCLDRCPDDPVEPGTLGLCGMDDSGSFVQDTLGDSDCDGLCDSEDNCPFTANSAQLNNNLLSEAVHNALGANDLGIGDHCEPALVPDGRPEDGDAHLALSIDTTFFKVRAEVVTRDEIVVRPQPSRQANDEPDVLPTTLPQLDVETHFRFCQETPIIDRTVDVNVDDIHLQLQLAGAFEETDIMPYHRVTMSFAPAQRGATTQLDYDGSTEHFTWDYEADGAFWDATGIVLFPGPDGAPVPGGTLGGPYSGLTGTFWMHAASDIGHPGGTILATGVHPGEDIEGTELLANRYFPSEPEQASVYHAVLPLELERPLFFWEILPDPPPWRAIIQGVRPGDDALLTATPGEHFALVSPDGSGHVVTDRIGEHLAQSLLDPTLRWTSAVEPSLAIGRADAPMALGLTAGGLIAEAVRISADQEGLLGMRDIGTGPPGTAGIAAAAATGPECADFEPVYSRMLDRLYLLGCLEPSGRRTIWWADVEDGTWSPLGVALPLGRVRAATLSHADNWLYLIDEAPDGAGGLRLLRIDPMLGRYEVLAEPRHRSNYDQHWLVSDRDGSILLAASSEQMNEAVIARIDVRSFSVTRAYKGRGPLAQPPLVQMRSYHLYRADGPGTSVERLESLEHKAFSWHRVEKLL